VGSIEKLETLRHLRHAPGPMPRVELARALRLEREAADALLGELARAGLVEDGDGGGTVRLGAAALSPTCDDLMRLYEEEDRVAVVSALSLQSMERIRSMAMRAFSEAFVSKRKAEQRQQPVLIPELDRELDREH
jgi:DNA-binding IscR family transcriptional regulator